MLDVKCPWPREDVIQRNDAANIEKYASLTLRVRTHFEDTTMETIIVPTAGPMPKHTHDVLVRIFGAKTATKVLCNMSSAVVRANFKLRFTLRMMIPTGRPARRGPPVSVPYEDDLEPSDPHGDAEPPPERSRCLQHTSTGHTPRGASP